MTQITPVGSITKIQTDLGLGRDDFFLFWSGPFSQWGRYDISLDGTAYNTCEQYSA